MIKYRYPKYKYMSNTYKRNSLRQQSPLTVKMALPNQGNLSQYQDHPWLRHVKHMCFVGLYGVWIATCVHLTVIMQDHETVTEGYGPMVTILVYVLQTIVIVVPLPITLCHCLGITLISVFPPKPQLKSSSLLGTFLCFRVVTRGLFPRLIIETLEKNLAVCESVGLTHFVFEVITERPLSLPKTSRVREVVVPPEYQTRRHTLFKARNLHYANEPGVNVLSDDDWIVHLDEETLLTEDAVVGILNFVSDGRHHFGQGVLHYSRQPIVNWITTLGNTPAVGNEYGLRRLMFSKFHQPFFESKGTFVVANVAAEIEVSYDHGPESSITEDSFFAIAATQNGYSFGFIEGEMIDMSPFTLKDFVLQRRRWYRGNVLLVFSSQFRLRYKVGPIMKFVLMLSNLVAFLSIIMMIFLAMILSETYCVICGFHVSTAHVLSLLSVFKMFRRHYGVIMCVILTVCAILLSPFIFALEVAAIILSFYQKDSDTFYVIQK